jgi:hypothetical protein
MIGFKHANYVNAELNPMYELMTELYEAMMDNEGPLVVTSCNKMIYRLSEIKKDHKSNEKTK